MGPTAEWDAALAELRAEWLSTREGPPVSSDPASCEESFDRLLQEQKQLKKQGRWTRGPADLMGVLLLSADEVRHCRVVSWLLDPQAPHGLGKGFLGLFLKAAIPGGSFDNLEAAFVRTEEPRETLPGPRPPGGSQVAPTLPGAALSPVTRADIVVYLPESTIVVEAKVNAGEQDEQCSRLAATWSDDRDPHFIFLTLRGGPPTTASWSKWNELTWKEVGDCLETALGATSAGRGRRAAQDYLMTLRRALK